MNALQLRELIEYVLKDMDMYSESAVELLMLTAAVESRGGQDIRQIGGGPARGIFQMEPDTEKDIWLNYLWFRDNKANIVRRYDTAGTGDLWWNIGYQIVLARYHYYRIPVALPSADDVNGLAHYWKKHWNTINGKGTVSKAIIKYHRYAK